MLPRRLVHACLLASLAAGTAAQDKQPLPPPPEGFERVRAPWYQVDLPIGWRAMSPTEAVQLKDRLPTALREVHPSHLFVYGDVDRWLAEGFDGRALLVVVDSTEHAIDAAHLEEIVEHWRAWRSDEGDRREILSAEVGTVGLDQHPALRLELQTIPGDPAASATRALEFYTSTSGRQLILSFTAWENSWHVAEPEIRQMARSLIFPRPPREPKELGGRLLQAAIVGGLVAFILLAIRHFRASARPSG